MHTYFDFRISSDPPHISLHWLRLQLAGDGCVHGQFHFSQRFYKGFFVLLMIWMNKMDASRLSRIVELHAFLFVELLLTFQTKFLAITDRVLMLLALS